ncbi:hypothetical protein CEUSTIGMA_g14099.t1, partial [Chlamydomonas eustigma]
MLIGSTVLANVIELKQQLGSMVEIKDLGVASYYLAMEVQQRSDKLLLTQQKYISEILERFRVPQFEKKHIPMDTRQFSVEDGDLLDDQSTAKYREMTGCLMYVCRGTRPDIAYSVGVLARYMMQPRTLHLKAAMDILKYLAATKLMGIEYGGERDTFVGYSDSDLGGCRDDSRSTTGFAFMLNGGAVSWRSRLQPTIADSSCEVEGGISISKIRSLAEKDGCRLLWCYQVSAATARFATWQSRKRASAGGVAAAARPAAPHPLHCIAVVAAPVPPAPNCSASAGGAAFAARPAAPPLHCIAAIAAPVPPPPNCRTSAGVLHLLQAPSTA